MIHRLIVLDRKKSIGITLFDNNTLKLQSDLLIGLVHALMLLGEELGPTKGSLREAELGKYQIGILTKDHLAYVVVQDSYDSEPFTYRIVSLVIDEFHDLLKQTNFNYRMKNEKKIRHRIAELVTTMKFPMELMPKVKELVNEFEVQTRGIFDTLILADLDDGIVTRFEYYDNNDNIIKLLMEILSEIPFERHWVGESKLREPRVINDSPKQYEAWTIYRVGLTDFCFLGRSYYNHGSERDNIISAMEELVAKTMNLILEHGGI